MVVIKKGKKTAKVTKSAYKNFFKGHGWLIDDSGVNEDIKTNESIEDTSDEDWDEVMEEVEKPLSEMNKQELEIKAASLGVNINGLTTNKQIRDAIRNYGK